MDVVTAARHSKGDNDGWCRKPFCFEWGCCAYYFLLLYFLFFPSLFSLLDFFLFDIANLNSQEALTLRTREVTKQRAYLNLYLKTSIL